MRYSSSLVIVSILMASAHAGAETVWTGEGSLSAGVTTGNTETTDVAGGLKLNREGDLWDIKTELKTEYGESDGLATRNRQHFAGQVDRNLSERLSLYTRGKYTQDEFSGFDRSIFVGPGAAYKAFDSETLKWSLEGGPGWQQDELSTGETEESIAVRGASLFKYDINEAVSLSNDTETTWTEVSTEISNSLALNAELIGNLTARFSFDVRHETEPPVGFEQTDTATRGALVYTF